jgi:hypothetical protein
MGTNRFYLKNLVFGLFLGVSLFGCRSDLKNMDFYEMKGFIDGKDYVVSSEEKNFFGKNYFKMNVIPAKGKNVDYTFLDFDCDCEFDAFEVNEGLEKKIFSRQNLPPEIPEALQKKYKMYLDSALIKNLKKIGYLK